MAAARERLVLVYSGTGNADGTLGDTILLGPPFVITEDELVLAADVLAEAIERVTAGVTARHLTAADAGRRPAVRRGPGTLRHRTQDPGVPSGHGRGPARSLPWSVP